MIENQNKFQLLLEEKQQQILELTLKQEKEISELKIQNELKLKKNETKSELQHQKTIENLKKDFEIHLKNFEKKILQEHEVKKLEKSKKIEEEKNDENDNKVIKKTEEFEKISIPQNLKEIFDEINSNETDQLDLHDMNLTDEEVSLIFVELLKNQSIVSIDFSNNKRIKGNFLPALEDYLVKTKILEE